MARIFKSISFSVVCFILMINYVLAQDIHLSQFYASPANLSPALTGVFNGDYRFVGNQRSQWRSITAPYTFNTFGGSFDANGIAGNKNLGAGASVYNDKGGDSDFNTLQINLAGSFSKKLSADSAHVLVIGLQSGFTQRSIIYSKLRFDNQYNGQNYDPNISNGENFSRNNLNYANLNAGISWIYNVSEKLGFISGLVLNNINKPKQSLFNTSGISLDRKFSLFTNAQIQLTEKWVLLPGFLSMFQGKYREYVIGSNAKYIINKQKGNYRALNFGAWTRAKDAGFLTLGMDYDNITAAISYDVTVSKLNPASNYKGGFEVSVIYIITKFNPIKTKYRVCPSFI